MRVVRASRAAGCVDEPTAASIEDFHGTQALRPSPPGDRAGGARRSSTRTRRRLVPVAGQPVRRAAARGGCASARGYSNAFFASSGSEAVEAALKLARAATRRPRILGLDGAYHGCTHGQLRADGARAPSAIRSRRTCRASRALPFGDVDALARRARAGRRRRRRRRADPGRGRRARRCPRDYVEALCELTARHGTLLVADEVQTGLGRTGRFLRARPGRAGPTRCCSAKHLGGGLVPISAMLTRRATCSSAPTAALRSRRGAQLHVQRQRARRCVAALAALDLLTDELIARVRAVGDALRGAPRRRRSRALRCSSRCAAPASWSASRCARRIIPWLSFEHFGVPELAEQPTHRSRRSSATASTGAASSASRAATTGASCALQPRFTIERGDARRVRHALAARSWTYLCRSGA